MYLGLDVGGTHTDAVLIKNRRVIASCKTPTDHANLLKSMTTAIESVIKDVELDKIKRINLSTTLSTNAIVEKKMERVGVIISAGPGIDAGNYKIGKDFLIIEGSINHRGTEIKPLDSEQLRQIPGDFVKKGIKVFAAVTKFSTRNPDQENVIFEKVSPDADFVTQGHKLSGQLSFPRRIATAYYNSAVWRIYNDFADAIDKTIQNLGINSSINILKADGGTIPLSQSRNIPVESILSGPAASVMGIISICDITEDSVILDIGGTTTDIAIFASGSPLIERDGITLEDNPTLIRSMHTKSIGIGGDSLIKIQNGEVTSGPERLGHAIALGGEQPTLVDALNAIGILKYGDIEKSIAGIKKLAEKNKIQPEILCNSALKFAVNSIKNEVESMLKIINSKPVYTIHEMLENKKIFPKKIYAMGGPALAFSNLVRKEFGIDVIVPENFEVANAIGAALSKTTFELELFADTTKGFLVIPNIDVKETITKTYTLEEAEKHAKEYLIAHMKKIGIAVLPDEIEIIESSLFKMVSGYSASGKDIRVKCQIKPDVIFKIESAAASK
jgi:N-methylhydantoinase A/oxoprolinase/acetone carboxylase beta subunit